MAKSLLTSRALCVITGASKGYGQCILERLAHRFPEGSCFLILARSLDKLNSVSQSVMDKHDSIKVCPFKFDQAKFSDCSEENIQRMMTAAGIDSSQYEQAVIVHNAGTLGDVTKFASQMSDSEMVEEAMNINVTGTILLNTSLLKVLKPVGQKVVINITSLAAIQAFPSWSLYCSGKAARNMFFKTLAIEDKSLRVLNWAPGAMDTDMQGLCRTSADEGLRKMFQDMFNEGKLLSCEASVDKLITVLERNTFTSGDHVDFYDV